MRHFLNSLINSGAVTVFTSLAMTAINAPAVSMYIWLPNWIISWSIVFAYVYFVAPQVAQFIVKRIAE